MSYILKRTAEEVTERALLPYVKEKVVESGISHARGLSEKRRIYS